MGRSQTDSGSIKIQGLGNGTNFKDMIDKLEKVEMNRIVQLNRWKKDWNTRLDAFKQVKAAMVEYSSSLKKLNTVDKFMIKSVNNSNPGVCSVKAFGSSDNTSHTIEVKQKATQSYASISLDLSDKLQSINNTGADATFEFTLDGVTKTLTVPPKCTLEGFKNLINQDFGNPSGNALGMRATIISGGGSKQILQLYSTQTGENTKINIPASGWSFLTTGPTPPISDPQTIANGWLTKDGQDAWVRVDGWPAQTSGGATDPNSWLKLSNNSITHIPGLSINITGQGTAVIDIALDTAAIKENVMSFVDATNKLRTLLKEYTDYDSTKQVLDSDYAQSQFETQKGGVLQGNYGMQLMMSKMKTLIMSKPLGFEYLERDAAGNVLSGDTFASLAQIGIKTDATQGSPTYGLLVFENNIATLTAGKTELITFEKALEMNAQNIAELFAADCEPTVDGKNFGYNSHVSSLTRPGNYDVSYEVDAAGNIFNATINGKAANYDPIHSQITLGSGPPKNDADGIALDIYNKNATSGTPHTGKIRLKSGFLPQLVAMVDRDFLDPDSGDADKEKGTLSVLISQYQEIIKGINEKISKEDERIDKWRKFTELRFARLESTLKVYSGLQAQLESQISALSSSGGKKK